MSNPATAAKHRDRIAKELQDFEAKGGQVLSIGNQMIDRPIPMVIDPKKAPSVKVNNAHDHLFKRKKD